MPQAYHDDQGVLKKLCTKCEFTYENPIEHFYKSDTTHDKLRSICKKCTSKETVARRPKKPKYIAKGPRAAEAKYRETHKEKIHERNRSEKSKAYQREYQRNRRKNNPPRKETEQQKDRRKILAKERKAKDPEKMRAYMRDRQAAFRQKHPERTRDYRETHKVQHKVTKNKWRKSNPLKDVEYNNNRRAKTHATGIDPVDYGFILQRDNDLCYICQKIILPTHRRDFDHVIPLSRGGLHTEENIKVTHSVCNRRKHDKLFSELTDYERKGP